MRRYYQRISSRTKASTLLRESIEAMNITQKDFAWIMGVQPSRLSELLNGKRPICVGFAVLCGYVLGIDPRFWLMEQIELDVVRTRFKVETILKWIAIRERLKKYRAGYKPVYKYKPSTRKNLKPVNPQKAEQLKSPWEWLFR